VLEQEDVLADLGAPLVAHRAADLLAQLAQRRRLTHALPDGGHVLARPRFHALGQRLGGRVDRLLACHHAGEVVEDVALDDPAALARPLQAAPVDVVLLGQPPRERGDVGLAHWSPPRRGGLAPACRIPLATRVYRDRFFASPPG